MKNEIDISVVTALIAGWMLWFAGAPIPAFLLVIPTIMYMIYLLAIAGLIYLIIKFFQSVFRGN